MGRTRMGCTKPCDLIESANSLRGSVRMSTRGWYFPRCSRSSGKVARRSPAKAAGWGTGGSPRPTPRFASRGLSSARPRPRDGFLPDMLQIPVTEVDSTDGIHAPAERLHRRDRLYGRVRRIVAANHLACERQVRKGAARFLVVKKHGLAEARGLRQAHIAWNHRAKHLVAEMLDQLRGYF